MAWREHCILLGFAWDELFRPAALFNGSEPLEGLVEIVVDDETHGHDLFIVNLGNHIDQFGL